MGWYESSNLRSLDADDRLKILQYVVSKYSRERVREAPGVSRITMWRLLG